MSDELIRRSREGIESSEFFLALGTMNFANSIRDPKDDEHYLIVSQIEYAKSLEKPAIILLERDLKAKDEQTIRDALEGMELIGVFRFEAGSEESMESAVIKMRKAVDSFTFRGEK